MLIFVFGVELNLKINVIVGFWDIYIIAMKINVLDQDYG